MGTAKSEPRAPKRATKKTTTKPRPRLKAKAASVEIEATVTEAAPAPPMRTAIKVLRAGQSWHGGTHAWDLPTQRADGSWGPGAWTPRVTPRLGSTGYHLTRDPVEWWGRDGDVVAYLAEHDGAVDDQGGEKISVERCRLLRPLTTAELEAHGIYFTGQHGEVTNARLIGGDARIDSLAGCEVREMRESSQVREMRGSSQVREMRGSSQVGVMRESSQVGEMRESSQVRVMRESSQVGVMRESSQVREMWESSQVREMRGSSQVGVMRESSQVREMWESSQVREMWESSQVRVMRESSQVREMRGSSQVGVMRESSTAHASGDAVVIVRRGYGDSRPTVTVRGRASVLDYRPSRPTHHVADEGQVLTLAADGTVSQAPTTEAADAR